MELTKIILIICDGMSDRRIESLGNKTPLEYAKKPNFDNIAKMGITGVLDILSPGVPPGSDAGHLSILGFDLEKYYPGRGPIEALGADLPVKEGSLACRFNFGTVYEKQGRSGLTLTVKDRRAGRISSSEAKLLTEYLQSKIGEIAGVKIKIIPNLEHRGILALEGENLSSEVTDSDPHEINMCVNKCEPTLPSRNLPAAQRTAEIINSVVKKSYQLLKDHPINKDRVKKSLLPANIILPRGAGFVKKIEPFSKVWGVKAACVAKLALYRGVARYIGMDVYDVEQATGDVNTNVEAKFRKALELLETYDFVFVHIKGADSASHDKKPLLKVKMIEKIDSALKIIIDNLIIPRKAVVAITSDHSTSSELGIHIGDPPAIVIAASDIVVDDVSRFTEKDVLKGGLGRMKSINLMSVLLNYASRAMEFGLRPSREIRLYRSDECTNLII